MNFFDLYFEEPEDSLEETVKVKDEPKIVDKLIECNREKSFKDTNKYNPKKNNKLIQDINNPKNNVHKRIFYKKDGSVGYIEIFQNPQLSFAFQTSNKVSFLFESKDNENANLDESNCFGFRYYNSKEEYCTLLKIGDKETYKFKFLEKIKDDGNMFYDESIDCFSIVYESIFSRYKELKNNIYSIIKEGPIYEILGFCYSILFKNTKYYKFHEPYTVDILNIKDFTNIVPMENNDNILNIVPILFDGHISILFFIDKNNNRGFILSDPSHVHSKNFGKQAYIDGFIFPKNMRKNTLLYPEKPIQKFNSCSFWFYFQMLALINYDEKIQKKKYVTPSNAISSIRNSDIYFDCINYYQKLFGFNKKLIEINPNLQSLDPDYIYSIPSAKYKLLKKVRVHKYGFLNQFVDLIQLIEIKTQDNISFKFGFEEIKLFQRYNEEFIDFILLLNYNLNFLYLNNYKDDNLSIILKIESTIEEMEKIKSSFIEECLLYFNKLIQDNNYNEDFKKNPNVFHLIFENQKNIFKITKEYYSKYENLKERTEKIIKLYPLIITSKILYPMIGALYNSK